jgi:hypothetical protein
MMSTTVMSESRVATAEEFERLHREGYFMRGEYFSPAEIDVVEDAADRAVAFHNGRVREVKSMYDEVSTKDGIRFVNEFADDCPYAPVLGNFARQPKIVDFARSIAGPRAAHHCYQLVYKYPQFRNPFPWHQDHMHTPADRHFYNMWIALSDMYVQNGCLRVLPRIGLDSVLEYHDTPYGKSCWPLEGASQGVPMEMKRGSIFVITSHTLHASGPNYTDNFRKAMLVAFLDADATVYGKPVRCTPYDEA